MRSIKLANFWARLSCAKWNKVKSLRHFAMKRYHQLAENFWESDKWQSRIRSYKRGDWSLNTYPWPYNNSEFANWEEHDGETPISDQSSCTIKHSTSYCAWKIFEFTGTWPQKTSEKQFDAKYWVQFLLEAGYQVIDETPIPGIRYVGVNPSRGEHGLVVWLEDIRERRAAISTYVNKEYSIEMVNITDYSWVRITNPANGA